MLYDGVVVGVENSALCAALSARECGASVLVLVRRPFRRARRQLPVHAGGFRFATGLDDS